jgi:pyruvate formate-lyase activating enzyme-like uncharacterized protein
MIESKIKFFHKKHNVIDNKKWLKNNLKMFEIEVFSYCNRKCWFCPNSYIDRKSDTILMPEESYLSVMEQLREIDYDQEITYSRYNEPLSKKDIILKRIRQAREYLPKVKLRTNTNGDYLNLNYIHELRDAGLNQLFIQQYLGNNQLYNHNRLKKIMIKKIERLGVNYSIITDIFNHRIEFNLEIYTAGTYDNKFKNHPEFRIATPDIEGLEHENDTKKKETLVIFCDFESNFGNL